MMVKLGPGVAFIIITINCYLGEVSSAQYFGKFIGKLSQLHHEVSGEVYAVDGRTLYLKDFTYDGHAPAAYFYASTGRVADGNGFKLRDESGSTQLRRRYRKEGVTLTLPEGKNLNNVKIFYVWCEEFDVNFGDVKISRSFDYPRPQKIDPLKGVHAISSDNIVIVDAQTLLIPNLSYDGEAPDAKFWVGRGSKPSPQGIRVPDENGKEVPLRRYDKKTVVLTLPGDLTVFDIGHFGIWCEAFTVDFGHVLIPQNLNVPPSLKMLGVSPQSKLNCEVLYDDLAFEVRWAVAGDSVVLQLVAKLDDREYMSFGVSGDNSQTAMIGSDVVVAWVDKETLKGYADDYYLSAKSQCSGPTGSCPDIRLGDNTNNIRLLNAAMVNGYSIVTYQRPLKASDQFDRQIYTNHSQPIVWAIGPLNQRNEVSFHSHYTKGDQFIDFGRAAKWNCPMPESEQPPMKAIPHVKEVEVTEAPSTTIRSRNSERRRGSNNRRQEVTTEATTTRATNTRSRTRGSNRNGERVSSRGTTNVVKTVPTPAPVSKRDAWDIPPIQCYEPDDGVFYAQMGPTGGKRGYPAITGHVGWGISWYINGLLIPVINVVRGKTYTFVVEGGFDPDVPARYHPFYITDDSVGGYEHKTEEEKKNVKIFAGAIFEKDGTVTPTGTGRLCHWTHQGDSDADDFDSFGAYQRTLELKCDQGEPGVIQWTPDKNTPNTVYYQCFTHRYLGWKINVVDSCDIQPAGSETLEVILPAPDNYDKDLEESPSILFETRVKPNVLITEDKSQDKDKSIVSEPKIDPPVTDPTSEPYRQPQLQLPKVPILIQPQQSYFNPPVLMSNHGSFFTNPYIFEQPLYLNPYQQQTFKPSPLIMAESQVSTTTDATTSTTSTTVTTTTTTAATSSSTTTEKHKFTGLLTASAIENKSNNHITPPSMRKKNNFAHFIARRPGMHKIHPNTFTLMKPPRPMPIRYMPPLANPYKKPVYKPLMRPPPPKQHNNNNKIQFSETKKTPPLFVSTPTTQPPPPPPPPPVKLVEISPQQAATEREPDLFTADSAGVKFEVYRHPTNTNYSFSYNNYYQLRPALNTGFHPESVVIESGFKPIVGDFPKPKIYQGGLQLNYESQIGVIKRSTTEKPLIIEPIPATSSTTTTQNPLLKVKTKRPYVKKIIIKHARSLQEPIAEAAERIESFYLPPSGKPPKVSQSTQIEIGPPPKIDLGSQPEIVVSYDGKRVSGSSLTAKVDRSVGVFDQKTSKATELIKTKPQFAPFKGELPPLNLGNINRDAPQFQSRGLINRDLNTPVVLSSSTKLSAIRVERRKRAAHHTPEHTAEQERQRNNQTQKSGTVGLRSYFCMFVVAVILINTI